MFCQLSGLVLSGIYWPIFPHFSAISDVIELPSKSEEAPIKTLELTSGVLIRKAAPVHFQEVACSRQCLMDSEDVLRHYSGPL
jgi:hypothetical protein